MTADLERRLRALREALPEPPAGIDLSAVATVSDDVSSTEPDAPSTDPVIVVEPASPAARRRRRTRWLVAATVAAALVVGVAVAAGIVRGGHEADPAPVAVTPLSTARIDPATQVVRVGDRVEGTGGIVAVTGRPVVFCALGYTTGFVADDPYQDCRNRVEVTGVDLTALAFRQDHPATATSAAWVSGSTHLSGVYRGDHLTDVVQSPYSQGDLVDLPQPPCAPPAGGWPQGPADANPDWTPVERYETAHPDQIVVSAVLRPSSTQIVVHLVTTADPAVVGAALRPTLDTALCVVRSRYTAAQIAEAVAVIGPSGPLWKRFGASSSSDGADLAADGQPELTVAMPVVTDEVLAATAGLAPGLVRIEPWLSPAR